MKHNVIYKFCYNVLECIRGIEQCVIVRLAHISYRNGLNLPPLRNCLNSKTKLARLNCIRGGRGRTKCRHRSDFYVYKRTPIIFKCASFSHIDIRHTICHNCMTLGHAEQFYSCGDQRHIDVSIRRNTFTRIK